MSYDFDTLIERRGTGSSKWSRYPPDVLPLWVADMDFAAAPEILAALERRLRHPILGYAVPQDALREQIVADMAARYRWTVSVEDIVFLPGVEPGFNMALKALLRPGDAVAVQSPIYRPILNAPGHWGLRRLDLDMGAPLEESLATLAAADALLLCNPHNPTGHVHTRAELEAIAAAIGDRPIIADEIHCELLFDGRVHIPMATLGPEVARRTITLMSAAKTYNIAGLKTAFAIIQDPALRDRFNAARLGMVDSVNLLGLEATLTAFADAGSWKAAMFAYVEANRNHLAAALTDHFPGIKMRLPDATFLAWLDCTGLGITDPQRFFLEEARVALSAGSEFGTAYGNYVRVNFGCPRHLLDEALSRMQAALTRLRAN